MADNVFNSSGTARLGPQAFAFDRNAMLAGQPATFVTPGITGGAGEAYFLPADLDGSNLPPNGAPNSFVEFPGSDTYKTFHYHVDFATPAQLDVHAVRRAGRRRLHAAVSGRQPRVRACSRAAPAQPSTASAIA